MKTKYLVIVMKSNREEIIERLIQLDKDVALLDNSADVYGMLNEYDERLLRDNYANYKERFK